jgi:hypothetical protein
LVSRLRPHLTFANVCSFLALFVALATGGAYAANTVFSTDIVDGQVRNADIADATPPGELGPQGVSTEKIEANAITAAQLANGAVGSSKVVDNSLTLTDLQGADVSGGEISVKKGAARAGGCIDINVPAPGAAAGETVMVSPQAGLPSATVLYGVRVAAPDQATIKVCYLKKRGKMPAITGLPVRIVTFG